MFQESTTQPQIPTQIAALKAQPQTRILSLLTRWGNSIFGRVVYLFYRIPIYSTVSRGGTIRTIPSLFNRNFYRCRRWPLRPGRWTARFIPCGWSGPDIDKYKAMLNPEQKDKIKFLGNQKDVESIINIFDVGVLVTNPGVYGEGISNSILEYMALAKPVIATDGGGNREIVNDGMTGFLIEPNQSETLREKVEYLLNNKKKALEMGRTGKERVVKEFNLERMTNDFIELYQRSINDFA